MAKKIPFTRKCNFCPTEFKTTYKTKKYCSDKCRFNAFMERTYIRKVPKR